ncbi:MAG: hypothetical protein K2X26_12680 [Chitinophagaceae bacterium]|jgi:hypothetical protein|nr:hypothetical protein [Chitinophagaceae bacterium]MCA6438885.1 hypothetical protein [Chitinophagaceae bacterium]
MPKTPGLVRRNLLTFKIRFIMKRNLIPYMPADQVRLCNADNDCIEARGDNARFIVLAVVTVLFATAAYYLSKIK